jgi:hypothetical protein
LGAQLDRIRSLRFEGKKEFARKALEYRIIGLLYTDLNEERYTVTKEARAIVMKAYGIEAAERLHSPKTPDEVQRMD